MAEAKKSSKRAFFDVKTNLISSKIQLYGASSESLNDKVVKIDLTRMLRGKNLELKLRVRYDGKDLVGEPESLELVGSYIRRMIRNGTDYVEDSFVAECKDGKVSVKPFLITRNKVSRAVRKELRDNAKKFLEGYLKARTTGELFTDVMASKMQKDLSLKLKKIYPLALCEIRVLRVEKEKSSISSEKK